MQKARSKPLNMEVLEMHMDEATVRLGKEEDHGQFMGSYFTRGISCMGILLTEELDNRRKKSRT